MLFAVRCSELLDLCGAPLRTERSCTCANGANLRASKPTNGAETLALSEALKQSLQLTPSALCTRTSALGCNDCFSASLSSIFFTSAPLVYLAVSLRFSTMSP